MNQHTEKYDSFDIDALTDEEFRSFFRFSREHISPLMQVLQLRKNYKASNGIRWSGEEGLCMVLRRLCYPNRLSDLNPYLWQASHRNVNNY